MGSVVQGVRFQLPGKTPDSKHFLWKVLDNERHGPWGRACVNKLWVSAGSGTELSASCQVPRCVTDPKQEKGTALASHPNKSRQTVGTEHTQLPTPANRSGRRATKRTVPRAQTRDTALGTQSPWELGLCPFPGDPLGARLPPVIGRGAQREGWSPTAESSRCDHVLQDEVHLGTLHNQEDLPHGRGEE